MTLLERSTVIYQVRLTTYTTHIYSLRLLATGPLQWGGHWYLVKLQAACISYNSYQVHHILMFLHQTTSLKIVYAVLNSIILMMYINKCDTAVSIVNPSYVLDKSSSTTGLQKYHVCKLTVTRCYMALSFGHIPYSNMKHISFSFFHEYEAYL